MAAEEEYTAPNQPYGHHNYWFCTYFVSVYDNLFILDALDGLKDFCCCANMLGLCYVLRDLQ